MERVGAGMVVGRDVIALAVQNEGAVLDPVRISSNDRAKVSMIRWLVVSLVVRTALGPVTGGKRTHSLCQSDIEQDRHIQPRRPDSHRCGPVPGETSSERHRE